MRLMSGAWWHAEGVSRDYGLESRRPEVGETVAFERAAWEVTHVRDAIPTDDEEQRLAAYRPEFRAAHEPYRISLRRLYGPAYPKENDRQEVALRVPDGTRWRFPRYDDGRVPLCSCCQHPWPCLERDQSEQAARELHKAERELALPPGCCPACQEPVTSRQKSITFGGPNVRNPLAEGPTFHLRQKCRHDAARYEEAWVADEPGRSRSLLTLTCAGTVIVHHDGSAECFGADGSDCPTVHARHRGYMACYLQTHGCGQECPVEGHPGTRVAGRPDDPRAVTRVEDAT